MFLLWTPFIFKQGSRLKKKKLKKQKKKIDCFTKCLRLLEQVSRVAPFSCFEQLNFKSIHLFVYLIYDFLNRCFVSESRHLFNHRRAFIKLEM